MTSAFEQLPAEIQHKIFDFVFGPIRVQRKSFPACGIRRKSLKERCQSQGCDFCTPQERFHLWLVSRDITDRLRNWLQDRPIVVCIPRSEYSDYEFIDYALPSRAVKRVTEVRIACYEFIEDLKVLKDLVNRYESLHTLRILPIWDGHYPPLTKNILFNVYKNWACAALSSLKKQSDLIKFTPRRDTALGTIPRILRHRIDRRNFQVLGSFPCYVSIWKRDESKPLKSYQCEGVSLLYILIY